jgi:hypothetical protein
MSVSDKVSEGRERPPISIWRRSAIGLVVLIVVTVVVGFAWQRWRGDRVSGRLGFVIDSLDETDPNWRLAELEAAREDIPEAKNSARVVVHVAGLLPKGWPTQAFDEKFLDQDLSPPVLLDDEQTALLDTEMKAQAPAVALARTLAGMPRGRHHLNFAVNPFNTLLPDIQETRRVAALLRFDAMHRAQHRDIPAALLSCRAGLNAGRSVGDEPFIISQLVRIACLAIACNSIERALAQGEATEADLALVQQLLAEEDRHPTMLVCMRGERAVIDDFFTKLENGTISTKEVEGLGSREMFAGDLQTRIFGLSRSTIRREHVRSLEVMTRLVEIAGMPEHKQAAEEGKIDQQFRTRREVSLSMMLLPSVLKISEACRRKKTQVRALMVAVAVERYRLKEKAWPNSLSDLVPRFLPAVPLDPYDGKPLRYVKRADGVTVYSVGADGSDDGGNIDRAHPLIKGVDQGYRLWNVNARRQPPAPKLPPEAGPGGPPPGGPPPPGK